MQKNYALKILFYLILPFALVSCSARRDLALFTAPTDIVTDTIKKVYVVNEQGAASYYKIKPHDLLAIRNIQNKEFGATTASSIANNASTNQLNGNSRNVLSYEVETDGKVNLPAIGSVEVAGLSRKEATSKIQELYQKNLLVDPIIELSVVNLKVTLLGDFGKQGNYLLERDNTTLIDIIGEAGGIGKTADPKTLRIIRGDRSHPELIYVNLNDINSLASKKLILQNNDIITIEQTKGSATGERLQNFNNVLQPLLVVVNLAVLIFTLTR